MDLFQKPREPRALILESATDITEHEMVWELVLQGVDLEVLFLLPGRDPAVPLATTGSFVFWMASYRLVWTTGDVISFVTTSSGTEYNLTMFGPFAEGGCRDTELVGSFPGCFTLSTDIRFLTDVSRVAY